MPVQPKGQLHARLARSFVDQMFDLDRSSSNSLREDIGTKKREPDGIDNAALTLPVLAEDIVLTRRKLEMCLGERPEIVDL